MRDRDLRQVKGPLKHAVNESREIRVIAMHIE